MKEKLSTEWWMWQMYRQVANFINEPNDANELGLKSIMVAYRNYHAQFDCEDLQSRRETIMEWR